MQIIDAHCHFGPGDGLNGPWDTRASLKKYELWAREAGINQTILFAAFHSDYSKANHIVWKKVLASPGRYLGFAFVHPIRDKGKVWSMIRRAVNLYGFKGIKVHRHDALISREICETAKAFRLPVLYDVMGKVSTVELLAKEYPMVNFIIPHLGSFGDDWKAQMAFIPLMERHANIFTDTSGIRRFDLLEMAVKRAGAHKVIFGSDGPWLHPGVELEKVFALKLRPREEKHVLAGNILRLIRAVKKNPKSYFDSTRIYGKSPSISLNKEIHDPWMITNS